MTQPVCLLTYSRLVTCFRGHFKRSLSTAHPLKPHKVKSKIDRVRLYKSLKYIHKHLLLNYCKGLITIMTIYRKQKLTLLSILGTELALNKYS
jgi:hypothetical protein